MRAYNFSSGPAMLPLEVLEQARDELTDWRGGGASVMEIGHRGSSFLGVAREAEADLRELLGIPDHFRVLFLQGGATAQFAAVPMNLAGPDAAADYVCTGHWSQKAIEEATGYLRVNQIADEAASGYTSVPDRRSLRATPGASYLHYTANETIGGVEFPYVPDSGDLPLVGDFSSTLLSRPLAVERFGIIYAGAQKNIGPAGLTVDIVRDELLGRARQGTPRVFNYRAVAEAESMLNTPPTFSWYVAGLVLQWLKRQGGLKVMAERNRAKAELLYAAIDKSVLFDNHVDPGCRSWMNVPFSIDRPELEKVFLGEAAREGLLNLEGHRSVGGLRASLYNAMPMDGVEALVAFMTDFERRHT